MSDFNFDADIENDDDLSDNFWQWGGKDATIFLFDCSPNMLKIIDGDLDKISYFIKGLKCAHSTAIRKIISSEQDLYSIVLFNTAQSKNGLDFSNIYVLQELDRPGAERILELENMIEDTNSNKFKKDIGSTQDASIHDVLWVCRSLFIGSKSKLATKNVLLFTCEDHPHSGDDHKQQQSLKGARDLKEGGIEFEVLPLGNNFDMSKFYKELLLEGTNEEESQSLSTLVDPANRFEELLERVRHYEYKQRSTGKIPFSIAPGVEMGVKVFTSIRKATKPSKVKLLKTTNEELTMQRKEMLESGEILMPSDFVKYQTYGGKRIKFTLDEVKSISKVHDPGIEILGFKPRSYLKSYLFIKPASFIYPDEGSYKGSRKLFACLLDRCLAKDVCPVVRVTVRQGSSVAWAFLLPQKEVKDDKGSQEKPPGFHICYLPFADDFRSIDLKNRTRAQSDQVDAAKEVMKKLHFRYSPESFENPDIQTHWRNIETLALNRAFLEPVTDYTVPDHGRIERKANQLIENFKSLALPDSYNPEEVAKKRPIAAAKAPAAKKPKLEVSVQNIENIANERKIDKLTVNDLKNFLKEKGVPITNKKKAQLVQDIYDVFNIDN